VKGGEKKKEAPTLTVRKHLMLRCLKPSSLIVSISDCGPEEEGRRKGGRGIGPFSFFFLYTPPGQRLALGPKGERRGGREKKGTSNSSLTSSFPPRFRIRTP